jgi:gamma-polyglutamate synthase
MRFLEYIHVLSANTLGELTLITIVALGAFMWRAMARTRELRRARARIPLVVGGWGTRGKSGVERLKAGLFHALGAEILVKTTGNEAMFIHSVPDQKPMEIFLFRPYDKATIWEQHVVTKLAADLGVQVLTWECMALNPRYVRILSNVWMRDDMVTITNTYPDHEDIQGPAGVDIPHVMTEFIPPNSECYTAEEQMLPILEEGARLKNTSLTSVGWRDTFFVTDDVLHRFPYQEHPSNIALIAKLGERLGIDYDFSVKEMADNVVPDIGVLRTYPVAHYRGRRLEFTLGNSANERRGFMNNWVRTGFSSHDDIESPDVWITTCVNNRSDRVSRSKVFASILVGDTRAHKHFLIGTNLSGLVGYLRDALAAHLSTVYVVPPDGEGFGVDAGDARIVELLREMKLGAIDVEDVGRKFAAMLIGVGLEPHVASELANGANIAQLLDSATWNDADIEVVDPPNARDAQAEAALDDIQQRLISADLDPDIAADAVAFLGGYARTLSSVQSLRAYARQTFEGAPSPDAIAQVNDRVREFLRRAFMRSLHPIDNAHATGDQIVDEIARNTPPGHWVRIMGCQNIKGTGLDFVYRWVAYDKVIERSVDLMAPAESVRMEAMRWFAGYKDYGVMGAPAALDSLEQASEARHNQTAAARQQLEAAIAHVREQMEEAQRALGESTSRGVASHAFEIVEQVLEARDSRKRRIRADGVLSELVRERISHARAEVVLRDLTKRQKGGWLEREVRARFARKSNTTRTGEDPTGGRRS